MVFGDEVNLRKSFLRLEEIYFLSLSLTQIEEIDEQRFALADGLFRKIIKREIYNPYFIKAESFQPIDDDEALVEQLEKAIVGQKALLLVFNHAPLKLFPYKITSFEGIWYLTADNVYEDRLSNYMISRIEELKILDETFERMPELDATLDQMESGWFQEGISFEVLVRIHSEIAEYFRLKKHLDSQKILETLENGDLLVSFKVTHDEDVDNLIKSWLPHIEVIRPERFRLRIIDELELYLGKVKS